MCADTTDLDTTQTLNCTFSCLLSLFLFALVLTLHTSLFLQQGEHGLDEHKLHVFLSALQSLIPPLFAVVLQNAPFTSRAKLHDDIPAIEGRTTTHIHTIEAVILKAVHLLSFHTVPVCLVLQ